MSLNLLNRKEDKKSEKKTLEDFIKKDENAEIEKSEEDVANCPKKVENVEKRQVEDIDALGCFGWKEEKTEKWLVKGAKGWFFLMSLLYFLFGALTFAPIIFIKNKISSVVGDDKMAFILSVALYVGFVLLFAIFVGSKCGNILTTA